MHFPGIFWPQKSYPVPVRSSNSGMDLVILLANFRDRGSEIDILVRKDQIKKNECVASFFWFFTIYFGEKNLKTQKLTGVQRGMLKVALLEIGFQSLCKKGNHLGDGPHILLSATSGCRETTEELSSTISVMQFNIILCTLGFCWIPLLGKWRVPHGRNEMSCTWYAAVVGSIGVLIMSLREKIKFIEFNNCRHPLMPESWRFTFYSFTVCGA